MKNKFLFSAILSTLFALHSQAQDPSFSQFFSSPLNINPALTAHINGDWRVISNFRDQWLGPASPYRTGTVSFDTKLFQNRFANITEDGNVAGAGIMLMNDNAMGGVVKSNYASGNVSYSVKLAEGAYKHKLGLGFAGIYGHRRIDFQRIDFEEQFTGYGFNTNMPTGETSLSSMRPYFSMSAGLLYSMSSEKSNFDLGVSGFHVNRPKQTFLQDQNQVLPVRYVVHANFEQFINEQTVINLNTIYQRQLTAKYYSVGGALGYILPNSQGMMVNAGLWYWSRNAIVPYLGFVINNYQFGFSYDMTTSKLNTASKKPNTWELSFIIKGKKRMTYEVPCPWR